MVWQKEKEGRTDFLTSFLITSYLVKCQWNNSVLFSWVANSSNFLLLRTLRENSILGIISHDILELGVKLNFFLFEFLQHLLFWSICTLFQRLVKPSNLKLHCIFKIALATIRRYNLEYLPDTFTLVDISSSCCVALRVAA